MGKDALPKLACMETSTLVITEPAVCLVDSDPAVRDSLQGLVALHGQAVRCYSTARAFLEEVSLVPVRCVICEARLPDRRGIDVYLALLSRGLKLPFALLVSRDIDRIRHEADYCGIALVVPKPIMNPVPLMEFIRDHLQGADLGMAHER